MTNLGLDIFETDSIEQGKNILTLFPSKTSDRYHEECLVNTLTGHLGQNDIYWISENQPTLQTDSYHINSVEQYVKYVEKNAFSETPSTIVFFHSNKEIMERTHKNSRFIALLTNHLVTVVFVLSSPMALHHRHYRFIDYVCVLEGSKMSVNQKRHFFRFFFQSLSSNRVLNLLLGYSKPFIITYNNKSSGIDDAIFELDVITDFPNLIEDTESLSNLLLGDEHNDEHNKEQEIVKRVDFEDEVVEINESSEEHNYQDEEVVEEENHEQEQQHEEEQQHEVIEENEKSQEKEVLYEDEEHHEEEEKHDIEEQDEEEKHDIEEEESSDKNVPVETPLLVRKKVGNRPTQRQRKKSYRNTRSHHSKSHKNGNSNVNKKKNGASSTNDDDSIEVNCSIM